MKLTRSASSGCGLARQTAMTFRGLWTLTVLAAAIASVYSPAQAGPVSTRADIRAPVAAIAFGSYSAARVTVASGANGSHSAIVTAPVTAVALGPGTTASVSIASTSRFRRSHVALPVTAVSTWRNVSIRM